MPRAAIDKAKFQRELRASERARTRKEIADAKAATRVARVEATATCASAQEQCSAARARYHETRGVRDALVKLAREYRLIRRAELRREAGEKKTRGPSIARVRESDDAVRANIPPEFVPLWEKIKGSIRGDARRSRTEAFLHYVEEHPDEVYAAIEIPSDDEYAASYARYAAGNPTELVVLGRLSRLKLADGREVIAPRGTVVAYDPSRKQASLVFVFGVTRSRRRAPERLEREYRNTHWGRTGAWGIGRGEMPTPKGAGTPILTIVYTTEKGADASSVDYAHDFDGQTLPRYIKGSGRTFQIRGGTYRVTSRGIVG